MEATGSTGGHFDLPNNEDGEKKSTHLELQEKYGGDLVTVSIILKKHIYSKILILSKNYSDSFK